MNTSQPDWKRIALNFSAVLARWLLGSAFIYTGLSKALHPADFLKLLRQYDLVQSSLPLNSIAGALPWFETFCGLLLLAGIAVRGTALTLMLMLVPFTVLVFRRALAIQSALVIPLCAVKFDCGCGTGEVAICPKLVQNIFLLALSAWLWCGAGRKLCLRYGLCTGTVRRSSD